MNYHVLPRTHLVSGSNHHPGIFEIPWQEMHLLVHEAAKLSGKSTMKVDVFYSRQEVMFIVMLVYFSILWSYIVYIYLYISSKTISIIWIFDSGNSACQLTLGLREMIQFQKNVSYEHGDHGYQMGTILPIASNKPLGSGYEQCGVFYVWELRTTGHPETEKLCQAWAKTLWLLPRWCDGNRNIMSSFWTLLGKHLVHSELLIIDCISKYYDSFELFFLVPLGLVRFDYGLTCEVNFKIS